MSTVLYILSSLVIVILDVLQCGLLARALISWIMPDDDNKLVQLVYIITEPPIAAVRALLYKLNIRINSPLDISHFITMLIVMLLQMLLSYSI